MLKAKSCNYFWLLFFLSLSSQLSFSQYYIRTDTIPVKENGNWLKMPWVGGHNYVQPSDIDLNFDGIKDLFIFDRSGHKITTYINNGTPNSVDYIHAPQYEQLFPHLEDWALLIDYDCDGKEDIFTYPITIGGIKVYKNTSTPGNLQFTLVKQYLKSNYNPTVTNLFVTRIDLPNITDVDGDGDLDVLTFDFSNTILQYHINQSQQMGYGCDSLIYQLDPAGCWGNFNEPAVGCGVSLQQACRVMSPDSITSDFDFKKSMAEYVTNNDGGNCSMCIDMDGDGDKDILLGQKCCNMVMLTNGGSTASADMIAMDDSFPVYDIPVMLTALPCGHYLDVNNDNKRDLIVAPNMPSISQNVKGVWYYKNIGTDSIPVFSRQTESFIQGEMIDVGEGANPVFFDFDSDGLMDLLISTNYKLTDSMCTSTNYEHNVSAYKNIGTAYSPAFELITTTFQNLSSQISNISSKHLTFGDLDADGDADMMMGESGGFIHYFENTAGAGNPVNLQLSVQSYLDNAGNPIDVGSYSTPQLIDADRDGDLDLIIGERAGNLNYYRNIGTPSTPSFLFVTNSFGGVDVMKPCCTGYSVPFLYDSLGSYRLLVGSESSTLTGQITGWIWHYKNIDGNLSGNFTMADSAFKNIWEGVNMAVHGKDITNDGLLDLVVGNYRGGVTFYMGSITPASVPETYLNTFDYSLYPNPATNEITLAVTSIDPNEKIEITIFNFLGEKILFLQELIDPTTTLINVSALTGGIYFCELKTQKFSKTKKLILIK